MERTSPCHYISPGAISVTPNANGSASDLAVYLGKNAKILVYSMGITALGWNDSAYRQWTLTGRNRRLSDDDKPYTIYARLSKNSSSDGYLIFAQKVADGDKWIDKYAYVTIKGLATGTANQNSSNYWYVKLGEVSLPVDGKRIVTLDTGILGTDQFNSEWNLDPDDMPLRVELTSAVDGVDAGDKPYVKWDKELVLSAKLLEGWTNADVERFHHWTIQRNTGNASADTVWNYPTANSSAEHPSTGRELPNGNIALSHARGEGDMFGGAVSSLWTVIAWGLKEDASSSSSENSSAPSSASSSSAIPEYVEKYEALAQGTINILAETAEQYALELSANMVNYDPTTDTYNPSEGIDVMVRATDQKGEVFKMTKAQLNNASLAVQYSVATLDQWNTCVFDGADDAVAKANIPTEAFHLQKPVNVRIVKVFMSDSSSSSSPANTTTYTELYRTPIAFVRNGEDSKEREWIFMRSQSAISFSSDASDTTKPLVPSLIAKGEVKPEEAAEGVDSNKNQDGWVPEGWWDKAHGTDDTYHYEYSAYRDYIREVAVDSSSSGNSPSSADAVSRGGHWGDFSTPRIWSYYAEDAVSYRCRWTLAGVEVYQLKCAYTGAFRGTLPLVATLMKRVGNGQEQEVTGETVIELRCDGIDFSKTFNADNPTFSVDADNADTKDFIQYLNNVALNGLSAVFTVNGEAHTFSIPVIREADEDSVKDTLDKYGSDMFLSKVKDDTASGQITFNKLIMLLNGMKIGGADSRYGIGSDASAVLYNTTVEGVLKALDKVYANHIESDNWKVDDPVGSGFRLMKDAAGITSMVVDKLTVRIKAILNELEIRKLSYVGGNIVISPAGGTIYRSVPLSDDDSKVYAFKCWMIADDGTTNTRNWWKVGDQAKCQTFNVDGAEVLDGGQALSVDGKMLTQDGELVTYDAGTGGSTGNKYYWRLVTETGSETLEDGKLYNYIVLSNEKTVSVTAEDGTVYTCEGMDSVFCGYDLDNMKWHEAMNDYPEKGDSIVQFGNQIDYKRQHAIIFSTVGETAPSVEEYCNVGARDGISPWNIDSRRMTCIAPRTGDTFVAKKFEIRTDSGTMVQVPVDRGEYTEGMVCGYYDRVSYNGSLWLCVCRIGNKVNETVYPPSEEYKLMDGSSIWLEQVKRGGDGYTVEFTPATLLVTQDLEGNYNLSDSRVYFRVFSSSTDVTDGCTVTSASGDAGCTVAVATDTAGRQYVYLTGIIDNASSGKINVTLQLHNGESITRELKYYVNSELAIRDALETYSVVLSPSVIILNEQNDGSFDFNSHWVSFKTYRGKEEITDKSQLIKVVGDYQYESGAEKGCVADKVEDNYGNLVIAIQNIIGKPEKGTIRAAFKLGEGYTVVKQIDYYVNWLGTFRHTIENDVSKMIAEKTTVTLNGESVTINDAVSSLEQTSNSISSRVESAVTEINGNIETVEKSVSEISQTSNAISLGVYGEDTNEYITEAAGYEMDCDTTHTYSFDSTSKLAQRMYAGVKLVAKIGVSAMSELNYPYGTISFKLLVNGNEIASVEKDYSELAFDWSTLVTIEGVWTSTAQVTDIQLVIDNQLGDIISEDDNTVDKITIVSHSLKRKPIESKEIDSGLKKTGIDIVQGKITINADTTEFTGDVDVYGTIQESNKQTDNANRFYPIDFSHNRSISIPAQSLVVLPMAGSVTCNFGKEEYFNTEYTFDPFQKAGTNVTITAQPVTEISNWSCMSTKLTVRGSEVKEVVDLNEDDDAQTVFSSMHKYMSLVCADPRMFIRTPHDGFVKLVSTAYGAEIGYGMTVVHDNQERYFFGNMQGRFLVNGAYTRFIGLLPGQILKLKSVMMYGNVIEAGNVSFNTTSGTPVLFWNVENASDFKPIQFELDEDEGDGGQYFFYRDTKYISPVGGFNYNFNETFFGHKMLDSDIWGVGGNGADGHLYSQDGKPRFYSVAPIQ